MKAKKCDRCGNYYDKNVSIKNGEYPANVAILRENRSVIDELDLCNDCMKKLYNFLGLLDCTSTDKCDGCFGAANNDCRICSAMKGDSQQ